MSFGSYAGFTLQPCHVEQTSSRLNFTVFFFKSRNCSLSFGNYSEVCSSRKITYLGNELAEPVSQPNAQTTRPTT